jgi:hypothetical protein
MRPLLAAVALLGIAIAPHAQPRSALDLATSRIITISSGDLGSGRIAGGDLGSGRIADRFLVTHAQRDAILNHPEAARAVERSGASHVVAAEGFSFRGAPVRDGVADCTQRATACFIVPNDPEALVLVVHRGSKARR